MIYLIARPIRTITDPPMIADVNSSLRAPSSVILLTHCVSVAAPMVCTLPFETIDVLSAVPDRVSEEGQEGHLRRLHPGPKRGGQRRTMQKKLWGRFSWPATRN